MSLHFLEVSVASNEMRGLVHFFSLNLFELIYSSDDVGLGEGRAGDRRNQ